MKQFNNIDFIIRADLLEKEPTDEELAEIVIEKLIIKRLKADKPVVIIFTGASGEGKSESALKVLAIILKTYGLDIKDWVDKAVIYTPFEYAEKLDLCLNNPDWKKVHALQLDEARNIVKNVKWNSTESQLISDINAMSRGLKPVAFLVVSQTIGDIDLSTRKTITYQFECERPIGGKVKMTLWKFFIDDSNPYKVELKKRFVKGVYVAKNHNKILYPSFEVSRLPKEVVDQYKALQYERKSRLIREKTKEMINLMKQEAGLIKTKVDELFEWYTSNEEKLLESTERYRGRIRLKQNLPELLQLTDWEKNELNKKLRNYDPDKEAVVNGISG